MHQLQRAYGNGPKPLTRPASHFGRRSQLAKRRRDPSSRVPRESYQELRLFVLLEFLLYAAKYNAQN